ncbi:MAG: NAD(P)(+) transhydrogenase (Re/Si-specific) subunit beta [bacterium]
MDAMVIYLYVLSAVMFIFSLKWMSAIRTSRWGNWAGAAGMLVAVLATLLAFGMHHSELLLLAIVIGSMIGIPIALKLPMTAVPQRTAMSHAFGSLAVALVGTAEYFQRAPAVDKFTTAVLATEIILGYLTFTGSVIAFAKLQELISGKPLIYPGRNVISIVVLAIAVILGIALVIDPTQAFLLPIMAFFALAFGFLLVMGIGGADMPTVIAILNSYAGLSAAALGFVLNNKLLIVAGTLDGSSGFILAILMCKAMNRSFANVLFGGVGATVNKPGSEGAPAARTVPSYTAEDASFILESAQSVVLVPGYGLAVAQAQHVLHDLAKTLMDRGATVRYAIHPVAGRMPGHMNVLLAEANVPYDLLLEMEHINEDFQNTDVALVIGANDVVNPAARHKKDSPLYGMPILNVDQARTVMVVKRSLGAGFAGEDNELFYDTKTMMLFGDAKKVVTELVNTLKAQ